MTAPAILRAPAPAEGPTLEVSEFQGRLLDQPEDVNLALTGGRGGAKTRAAALMALAHLGHYGPTAAVLWLRRSHPGVRDAASQLLETFNEALGRRGYRYNSNDGLFRLAGGGTLELNQLSAASDYWKFQGRSFSMIVVDEAQQYSTPGLLDKLRSNLRGPAGVPTRLLLLANPGDTGHAWIAKRHATREPWKPYSEDWLEGEAGPRRWLTCPSTYRDNPFLDSEAYARELAAACADDPELLRAWLDGDWSVIRGAYFADVLGDHNVIPEWPSDLFRRFREDGCPDYRHDDVGRVRFTGDPSFYLALDYGSAAPSVCYLLMRSGGLTVGDRYFRPGSILALDEVALAHDSDPTEGLHLTIPEQAREFLDLAARWGVPPLGCADDACFADTGHAAGTIADEFKKAGLRLFPAGKGGRVAGWQRLRSLLQGAATPDRPGLFLSRRCRYAWQTLPYLMRSPTRREDVDTTGPDHGGDSLRYGCGWERPKGYAVHLR